MRLFFAINFEEQFKQVISNEIYRIKHNTDGIKWTNRHSLHLTLKFLGDTSAEVCNTICDQFNNSFENINSFQISSGSTGFFPNRRNPGIFFLDLNFPAELTALFELLEEKLRLYGFDKEKRKFHPHITLARIKRDLFNPDAMDILDSFAIKTIQSSVTEILLIQSKLTATGARYTPVQKFSLRTI